MEKKNKAAKAVNTALGLIVIVAVILCSPLFGYARGFASPEQRQASAVQSVAGTELSYSPAHAAATPRPTAMPTPTPVVLPSAPPAPSPTPVPTPKPVAVPQPVQQPVQQAAQPVQQQAQQAWQPEEYWGVEDYSEGYDEDAGAADAGYDGAAEEQQSYAGLGEQVQNGMIATGSADIVINADMGGGDAGGYTGYQETTVQPENDYAPPVQDISEGEAFVF